MKIINNQIVRDNSPPCNKLSNLIVLIYKIIMKYYLIISISFLFLSCQKDKIKYNVPCNMPTTEINASRALIIGNWTWVSELYRDQQTGQIILKNPQTEGYIRTLRANKERLAFYKNNVFEQNYRYDFVIESSITNYFGDSSNVLVFKDFTTDIRTNHTHFKLCNDTLTLNFQIRSSVAGIEKWTKQK